MGIFSLSLELQGDGRADVYGGRGFCGDHGVCGESGLFVGEAFVFGQSFAGHALPEPPTWPKTPFSADTADISPATARPRILGPDTGGCPSRVFV